MTRGLQAHVCLRSLNCVDFRGPPGTRTGPGPGSNPLPGTRGGPGPRARDSEPRGSGPGPGPGARARAHKNTRLKSTQVIVLPVLGPGFRGWFWRFWPLPQTARAEGPGNLGPDFGPSALALRPKPIQNRPGEPGPGIGNNIKQPQTGYPKAVWPDFVGCVLRSGRPRGPGKPSKM